MRIFAIIVATTHSSKIRKLKEAFVCRVELRGAKSSLISDGVTNVDKTTRRRNRSISD